MSSGREVAALFWAGPRQEIQPRGCPSPRIRKPIQAMPEGQVYSFSVDTWYLIPGRMATAEKIAGSRIDMVI
jgi:hypothetical protein